MTSDSLYVLAVALITLGGVFFYLLRVEALAKKLESQVRDDELDSPHSTEAPLASALDNGVPTRESAPLASALENSAPASSGRELPLS